MKLKRQLNLQNSRCHDICLYKSFVEFHCGIIFQKSLELFRKVNFWSTYQYLMEKQEFSVNSRQCHMIGTGAVSMLSHFLSYLFKYPMTHILQCWLDCMNTFTLSSSSLHDKASGRFMGVLSFTCICINGSKHFLHRKGVFSSNSQLLKDDWIVRLPPMVTKQSI